MPQPELSLQVVGVLEPWAAGLEADIRIDLLANGRTLTDSIRPNGAGFFAFSVIRYNADKPPDQVELQALLGDHVIGRAKVAVSKRYSGIATKLRIMPLPPKTAASRGGARNEIVSGQSVWKLAHALARLQDTSVWQARVPRTVMKAVAQLNRAGRLAAASLGGDQAAAKEFAAMLAEQAVYSPGGAPGVTGPLRDHLANALDSDGLGFARGCVVGIDRAERIIDAGVQADLLARNKDAFFVRQAAALVIDRLRTVREYGSSVQRALTYGEARDLPGSGPGSEVDTVPILGPDGAPGAAVPLGGLGGDGIDGPPDGVDPMAPDLCQLISQLCLDLYASVAAESSGDPFIDLIGSVDYLDNAGVAHPAQLCSIDFDPARVYVARAAANHAPPTFPTPLPPNVQLHFRDQVLTPISVAPDEIRFRLPPDPMLFHTGFVYLRTIGPSLQHVTQQLARICGRINPAIPDAVLFDRSPAAQISVIYPPVVDVFSASQTDAEACHSVDLRWQAHLSDQDPAWPIPGGGQITVDTVDDQGAVIVRGGAPTGSVQVASSDTRTYTLTATSTVAGHGCGSTTATTTIRRTRYVYLEWDPGDLQRLTTVPDSDGAPIAAGNNGQFNVVVSCDVPADLQVQLVSDAPAVLQVPGLAVIRQGTHRTARPIVFGTAAAACRSVTVTVAAAGHTAALPPGVWPPVGYPAVDPSPGHYDVYTPPQLAWSEPVPNPIDRQSVTADVTTTCLPVDSSRVEWLLTDPNGATQIISSVMSVNPDISSVMSVSPGLCHLTIAAGVLTQGAWSLQARIPSRQNVLSNQLALVVAAAPTFVIDVRETAPGSGSVEWDQTATFDVAVTGQNIPAAGLDVDLSAVGLPAGSMSSFQPQANPASNRVHLAGGAAVHTTLAVSAIFGSTQLGTRQFQVQGGATLATRRLMVRSPLRNITIRRTHGDFIPVPLPLLTAVPMGMPPTNRQTASCDAGTPHCASAGVSAVVTGTPNNYFVHFETPGGNSRPDMSTGSFAFSHGCRAGLEIPALGMNLQTKFFNLGFSSTVFPGTAVAIGGLLLDAQDRWQGYLFSPDETLIIIWGSSGVTMPPGDAQQAWLYDLARQRQINRSNDTFTGFNMTARLVAPNPPGQPATTVVFTFTDIAGQNPQSMTWTVPD
jgi:hypothetical protein